jgi:hypothetical protein
MVRSISIYNLGRLASVWLSAALLLVACGDPVPEEKIADLGPEAPGVPVSALHRPGQPCVLCHAGKWPGDAEPTLALGGTVYVYNPNFRCDNDETVAAASVPAANVEVHVQDAAGRRITMLTNAAGNFMLKSSEGEPTYPFWTKIRYKDPSGVMPPVDVAMNTHVFRDGSCATCHQNTLGAESAGPIHLVKDQSSELALTLFPNATPPACPPAPAQ